MLYGWDATESDQYVTTTTVTADNPEDTSNDTTSTTYTFGATVYRLFDNSLSDLQIKTGQSIFYKIGVKIFDDSDPTKAVQIGNGISVFKELVVPEGAMQSL